MGKQNKKSTSTVGNKEILKLKALLGDAALALAYAIIDIKDSFTEEEKEVHKKFKKRMNSYSKAEEMGELLNLDNCLMNHLESVIEIIHGESIDRVEENFNGDRKKVVEYIQKGEWRKDVDGNPIPKESNNNEPQVSPEEFVENIIKGILG
jgi:hypothetical protein